MKTEEKWRQKSKSWRSKRSEDRRLSQENGMWRKLTQTMVSETRSGFVPIGSPGFSLASHPLATSANRLARALLVHDYNQLYRIYILYIYYIYTYIPIYSPKNMNSPYHLHKKKTSKVLLPCCSCPRIKSWWMRTTTAPRLAGCPLMDQTMVPLALSAAE